MRLGIGSYTYTWAVGVPGTLPEHPLSAPDLLARAAELGIRVVQFADNLPLDRLSMQELQDLAVQANELGISIEAGTRGIDPAHLRQYLNLAHFFQSSILRVVVDTAAYQPSPTEVIDILLPLRTEFEAARVTLAIENHDRFSCRTLANIVHRLGPDWAGICLDTVNSLGALEGPEVVVAELGPLTVNLHLKDFTITRASHNLGFSVEGRPAGQGRLDVPWLLAELKRGGCNPNAILELWTPPEPAITETISKEDFWARESISYLRQLIQE